MLSTQHSLRKSCAEMFFFYVAKDIDDCITEARFPGVSVMSLGTGVSRALCRHCLPLSVSLLSLSLSHCLPLSVSLSLSPLSLSLSVCLSVCLSLSVRPSICPSVVGRSLSVCLAVCFCFSLRFSLNINVFASEAFCEHLLFALFWKNLRSLARFPGPQYSQTQIVWLVDSLAFLQACLMRHSRRACDYVSHHRTKAIPETETM